VQATHNNQIKKDALRAPIMGVTEGLLVAHNGSHSKLVKALFFGRYRPAAVVFSTTLYTVKKLYRAW
jgi:hypothetical protein